MDYRFLQFFERAIRVPVHSLDEFFKRIIFCFADAVLEHSLGATEGQPVRPA
jgi:hypothetical protein